MEEPYVRWLVSTSKPHFRKNKIRVRSFRTCEDYNAIGSQVRP